MDMRDGAGMIEGGSMRAGEASDGREQQIVAAHPMRILSTHLVAFAACAVIAAAAAMLQGCAVGGPQYSEAPSVPAQVGAAQGAGAQGVAAQGRGGGKDGPASGVTGVWQGQSWANCNVIMMLDETRCGAVNSITLTLLQKDAKVTGFYRCAFGNMDCLNLNETGRVAAGNMGPSLLTMRVMMPDGSDCMFNGRPKGDAMQGTYSCLQGGSLIEQGLWKARRSY
jgi:hypothetical protein